MRLRSKSVASERSRTRHADRRRGRKKRRGTTPRRPPARSRPVMMSLGRLQTEDTTGVNEQVGEHLPLCGEHDPLVCSVDEAGCDGVVDALAIHPDEPPATAVTGCEVVDVNCTGGRLEQVDQDTQRKSTVA